MFEFYYQSGEFVGDGGSSFWPNLFIEVVGAIAGVLVAVWYGIRQYRQEISDQNAEKDQQEKALYLNKVKYFNHLVKGSVKFGDGLVNSINKLITSLKEDIYTIPEIALGSWDDLVRVVELTDREIHYHAYLNIVSNEKINDMFSDLDTLNRVRSIYVQLHTNKFMYVGSSKKSVSEAVKGSTKLIKKLKPTEGISSKFTSKIFLHNRNFSDLSLVHGPNFDYLGSRYFPSIGSTITEFFGGVPPTFIDDLYFISIEGAVEVNKIKETNVLLINELTKIVSNVKTIVDRIRADSVSMQFAIDTYVLPSSQKGTESWLRKNF